MFSLRRFTQGLRRAGTAALRFRNSAQASGKRFGLLLVSPVLALSFAFYHQFNTIRTADEAPKPPTSGDDLQEVTVLNANELLDGDMKEVQVGPTKDDTVLIARVDGKLYCTGSRCTHLGAPLAQGVLFDDKLVCPWHCAAFSILNGHPEQGPVLDGLPTFPIREENGKIIVKVPKSLIFRKTIPMVSQSSDDKRRFVIIGGGPAAISAAETLRQSGYQGEIIMVTQEEELPYDRTMLSKAIFQMPYQKLMLRDQNFYNQYGIKVINKTKVKGINTTTNTIEVEGETKEPIKYDKLLVASGGIPRVPNIPGTNLNNVFTLRSYRDAITLKDASANAKNVVVVGASFIGMETASMIKKQFKEGVNVTVCDVIKTPFERAYGDKVGNTLKTLHEKNGVKFQLGKGIKSIQGDQNVKEVELADGTKLQADLVILGTGIAPNTAFLGNSVKLAQDGGVVTNPLLKSSNPNIFAAGDINHFPYWYTGDSLRIEHYNEAYQQGSNAAFNMLGKNIAYETIPFFWSRQWDNTIGYTGFTTTWDDVFIDGSLDEMKFIAYYIKDNRVLAAASMGRSPALMIINQAMRLNVVPPANQLKEGKVNLDTIKKRVLEQKGRCKCRRDHCCQKKALAEKAKPTA